MAGYGDRTISTGRLHQAEELAFEGILNNVLKRQQGGEVMSSIKVGKWICKTFKQRPSPLVATQGRPWGCLYLPWASSEKLREKQKFKQENNSYLCYWEMMDMNNEYGKYILLYLKYYTNLDIIPFAKSHAFLFY